MFEGVVMISWGMMIDNAPKMWHVLSISSYRVATESQSILLAMLHCFVVLSHASANSDYLNQAPSSMCN